MTKIHIRKLDKLTLLFCGLSFLTGAVLSFHTILNWDQPEVIVEWETASELDTIGFNVLRSENPEGSYMQVNSQLIPTDSDSLTGNQYTYHDTVPKAGTTYFYMLEEIEITGNSNRHGPIEVKANNQALIEVILALFLIVGAVILFSYSWQDIRKQWKNQIDESS